MMEVFTAHEAVKDPQGHILFHAGEEVRWRADSWDRPIRVYRRGQLARTFGPYHTPAIFAGLRDGSLQRVDPHPDSVAGGPRDPLVSIVSRRSRPHLQRMM
jgi:hypothetical protein